MFTYSYNCDLAARTVWKDRLCLLTFPSFWWPKCVIGIWGVWREESHEPGVISIISGYWIHCVKYQTMQCQECRPETLLSDARDLFFSLTGANTRQEKLPLCTWKVSLWGLFHRVWVTWPEWYKLSNVSYLVPPRRSWPGQSWDFLREDVVQWRCSIFLSWVNESDGGMDTCRRTWYRPSGEFGVWFYDLWQQAITTFVYFLKLCQMRGFFRGQRSCNLKKNAEQQNDRGTTSQTRAACKELGDDEARVCTPKCRLIRAEMRPVCGLSAF